MAKAARAPEELSTVANVMTAPPLPIFPQGVHGTLIVMGFLVPVPPAGSEPAKAAMG